MTAAVMRRRARDDIVRLVHRGLGVEEFSRAATRALRRAVPFDGACVLTLDPATLLPTGEVVENGLPPAATARLTEIEVGEPDVNKFTALARAPRPAASLSAATGGRLDRSRRQRELRRPSGFEDELRAVLPGSTGTWGALTLLRSTGTPHFTGAEVGFVASVAGALGDGLRRAALLGDTAGPAAGDAAEAGDAGLLVLGPDGTVELANGPADRWLADLVPADGPGSLPVVVHAVARRAREAGSGRGDGGLARARVRTATGRWVVVRGSLLGDGDGDGERVGVLLEPARPPELAPLIADALGITEQERRVTELVAQGLSNIEVARRLRVSSYTVQDHLKAVFEKSGTSSRGDLVARLFFDHHAPRLTARASGPGRGSGGPRPR
jgi:DNA-binding CsgD family transcriptional regulator